jgi:murein DD-endopeptidase MepM/ murein hydrolase activator NlpD
MLLAACGGLQWPPQTSEPRLANPPPVPRQSRPRRPVKRKAPLPVPASVKVLPGETIYSLARHYGVSVRGIIEANHLGAPYELRPGQRLVLPRARYHKVVRGDTLYGISRRHGVDLYLLARVNRLAPPYRILIGQRLRLPGLAAPASTPLASAPRVPVKPTSKPRPGATPPSVEKGPAKSAARKHAPAKPPPPLPRRLGKGGFIWPVRGRILSGFGPKGNGLHNDGINIAAKQGTPVRAVRSGVVAYAGNELRGFGNLVLIKHSGGWVTAYAHNQKLLVRRGQRVARGQAIARVGRTGNVQAPQLHFEMRRGKKAVDPARHLARRQAGRTTPTGWNQSSLRPSRPARS